MLVRATLLNFTHGICIWIEIMKMFHFFYPNAFENCHILHMLHEDCYDPLFKENIPLQTDTFFMILWHILGPDNDAPEYRIELWKCTSVSGPHPNLGIYFGGSQGVTFLDHFDWASFYYTCINNLVPCLQAFFPRAYNI